jgi:hypothetical protein
MARDAAFISPTHPLALSPPLALSLQSQKARGTLRKLGQIAPFAGPNGEADCSRRSIFFDPLDRNAVEIF